MLELFAEIPLLFAQNPPAANGGSTSSFLWTNLPFVAVIGVWVYFLFLRPQQQQERKRREMMSALKKNDKVLTSAGIYGTVVSVDRDQDKVVLQIGDDRGVKVVFTKSAVTKVIDSAVEKEKEKEKAAEPA